MMQETRFRKILVIDRVEHFYASSAADEHMGVYICAPSHCQLLAKGVSRIFREVEDVVVALAQPRLLVGVARSPRLHSRWSLQMALTKTVPMLCLGGMC